MNIFKRLFGKKSKKISENATNISAETNSSAKNKSKKISNNQKKIPLREVNSPKATGAEIKKTSDKTPSNLTNKNITSGDNKPKKTVVEPPKNAVALTEKGITPSDKKAMPSAAKSKTNTINTTHKSAATKKASDHVTEVKSTRNGKFEIKKSKDGRYVFNLYASNNVIVATSQVYSSSSSALNGIKSVIANAPSAPIEDQTAKDCVTLTYPKWEIYRDKGNQYRFRLSASNGSCICHSQGYTSKTNCKKGIESIIKFAGDADIIKAYINKDK